jgi:hypothetical protein
MSTARNLVTLTRSTSRRLASRHLALVSTQGYLVHSHSSALLEFSLGSWKRSILLALRTIFPCNSSRRCRKNSTRGTTPLHHTCAFHLQTISQQPGLLAAVLLCWYVTWTSHRIHWLISTVIDLPLHPCSHPSPSCMRLPRPTSFFVITCSCWIFEARHPNH